MLLPLSELLSGRHDCQSVSVEGVAQRFRTNGFGVAQMELATESGVFPVFVNGGESLSSAGVLDSKLRIRGVCFTNFNSRGELMGIQIRAGSPADVQVLQPGHADPFEAPEVAPLALQPYRWEGPSLHRQRLVGTVTLARPGQFFYVQAAYRNFRVETRQGDALVPGDRVEASGFVSKTPHFAVLREAVFRKTGVAEPPVPNPVRPVDLLGWPTLGTALRLEDHDGELIQMRGKLLKIEPEEDTERRVYFEADGMVRVAVLPPGNAAEALAGWVPGSEVQMSGICVQRLGTRDLETHRTKSVGFELLLRGAGDVVILKTPPWWTKERLGWALGGASLILAALGGWNFTLRRRVLAQTRLITEKVANESRLEERQRIGRELHDTLLQELAGITLLLESTKRHLHEPSKAMETLHMAERMAHRCRVESRSSVQDLMSISLENGGLPLAIAELVRPLAEAGGIPLRVQFPPDLGRLGARIETALLRIAHEAVANAVKHSKASGIELSLGRVPEGWVLSVHDDGCGFEYNRRGAAPSGHFGLLGMDGHAVRMGGRLEICSSAGMGTTVVARLPLA
jgi:signal transduction histidine kinase